MGCIYPTARILGRYSVPHRTFRSIIPIMSQKDFPSPFPQCQTFPGRLANKTSSRPPSRPPRLGQSLCATRPHFIMSSPSPHGHNSLTVGKRDTRQLIIHSKPKLPLLSTGSFTGKTCLRRTSWHSSPHILVVWSLARSRLPQFPQTTSGFMNIIQCLTGWGSRPKSRIRHIRMVNLIDFRLHSQSDLFVSFHWINFHRLGICIISTVSIFLFFPDPLLSLEFPLIATS
jgi:hypothetical protein